MLQLVRTKSTLRNRVTQLAIASFFFVTLMNQAQAADCNGNGVADEIEATFPMFDCNDSGVPDECEIRTHLTESESITNTSDGAFAVFPVDLDQDGDIDLVAASVIDDSISWYENTDGNGTFGPAHVITSSANGARSVFAADFDGDGDMDVLSGASVFDESEIVWHENTDGLGTFAVHHVISEVPDGARTVIAADLDGDGDEDVIATFLYGNRVVWYENTDGLGTFGGEQIINAAVSQPRSVYAADFDNDSDLDVAYASFNSNVLVWHENSDGLGTFGTQHLISVAIQGTASVIAADIDRDGAIDVLTASQLDNKIAWYRNNDGAGSFGNQRIITTDAEAAHSVFAIDLDNDGDMDVLSASQGDNKIAWYENTNGQGLFGPQLVITSEAGGASAVSAADIDGDGDFDAISASFSNDTIAWHENYRLADCNINGVPDECELPTGDCNGNGILDDCETGGDCDSNGIIDSCEIAGEPALDCNANEVLDICETGNDCNNNEIPDECEIAGDPSLDCNANGALDECEGDCNANGLSDVCEILADLALDCDTDGLLDECEFETIFKSQQVISTEADEAFFVIAADIDGDGDKDVLSASRRDDKVAWYENTDGLATFGPQRVITTEAAGARSVFADDLDGDGDLDVLSVSADDNKLAWFENLDGQGSFGPQQVISTELSFAKTVYAADLDGDGDADVVSGSTSDNKVAWYENTDGLGSFGPQQVISSTAYGVHSVVCSDMDVDGDLDVIAGLSTRVVWYENTNGQGDFGPFKLVARPLFEAHSVFADDIDGDGDIDVLSAQYGHVISWSANTNGLGSFGPQQIITTNVNVGSSVFAADLDNDGDSDVISGSQFDGKVAWYENVDGLGSFGAQQVVAQIATAISISAADLNGDGDIDILSASMNDDKIAWYENSILYDCNKNGVHDACESDADGDSLIDVCDPCAGGLGSGDSDANGVVNLDDFANMEACLVGPDGALGVGCECFDFDSDGDNDLYDFAAFTASY